MLREPSPTGRLRLWLAETGIYATTTTGEFTGKPCPPDLLAELRQSVNAMEAYGLDSTPLRKVLEDYDNGSALSPWWSNALYLLERFKDRQVEGAALAKATTNPTGQKEPQSKERFWTKQHCPNCGAADGKFISITQFASDTGILEKTVRNRMAAGKYWQDKLNQLPWCPTCREKTPEGEGVERRVEGLPALKLNKTQLMEILEWTRDLIVARYKLPKIPLDRIPRRDTTQEQLAWDYLMHGAGAVHERACKLNEIPSRTEVEATAQAAIDELKKENLNPQQFRRPKGSVDFESIIGNIAVRKVL